MRRLARLVAAALVVAAAGPVVPATAAPAAAAPCASDTGVTVVVDFNGLGGGVQQVCVAGGGGDAASSLFPAAGFQLTYASRQPGFVCRVKGVPASDPCVNTAPADAFWGLWWSDGSGWKFSSLGAASVTIPDGGLVAFSWDDVGGTAPPSASPSHPDPPSTPEPTQPPPDQPDDPGQAPGGGPTTGPGSQEPGSSPSASPSASDDQEGGKRGDDGRKGKRGPKPDLSDDATPTIPEVGPLESEAADAGSVAEPASDSDGLPGWVAPTLIGILFAAAGVVLLVRRRRSDT